MAKPQVFLSTLVVGMAVQGSAAQFARAQSALEEIVVTARKRTENLQDIPISVTAFSSDQLERSTAMNLEDVARQTPGLIFNNTLGGTRPGRLFSNIRFRGIEGDEFSTSTAETASLFIDGVYALQGAQTISLMDLERVEVIKGPQATQFGRNSFAGAINYITRLPTADRYAAKVSADAATYDQYEVQASVEGPLVKDKVALRTSARFYNKGAMFTANDGGRLGAQSSKAVSGDLYATPSDRLTVRARVFYQHDDDGPAAVVYLPGSVLDTCKGTTRPGLDDNGNPVTLHPVGMICGAIPNPGQPGAPKVSYNTSLHPALLQFGQGTRLPQPNLVITGLADNPQIPGVPRLDSMGLKRNVIRTSLTSTYTFEGGITATATGAYNSNKSNDLRDWDMTDNEAWYVTNPQKASDYSFDFRVASPAKERLQWLGGVSYYKQTYTTSINGGKLVAPCVFSCSGPLQSGVFNQPLDGTDGVKTWGVYGSVSYDILHNLILDLEGRYQQEEHSTLSFSKKFKQFLPRVTLSYKPEQNLTLYGNWSQGKLPGVINANLLTCDATPFKVPFTDPRTGKPSTSSVCDQYQQALGSRAVNFTPQQTLNAFELGIKSTLAEGRAVINVAGYYDKWSNDPFTTSVTLFQGTNGVPNPQPTFLQVSTAGSVKSYGLELQTAFIPAEGWTIDAGGQWNINKFIEFTVNNHASALSLGTDNVKGNRADRYPEWSFNASSTYTHHLTESWDWYTRGDVYWQGKAFSGYTNLSWTTPFALVNAHVGLERDKLRVEAYVKNLFNQRNWAAASEFTDFSIPGDFGFNLNGNILVPQDKRTFGLRLSLEL